MKLTHFVLLIFLAFCMGFTTAMFIAGHTDWECWGVGGLC